MKLVDRHLSAEFGRAFAFSALAFLAVFLTVEFFENLKLVIGSGARTADIFLFFGARLPWMASQVVPMAALLGTLVSLTLLSRRGEITAFRCGGVSLLRLALPFLACGAAVSAFQVVLQELTVPRTSAFAQEVKQVRLKKRSPHALFYTEDVWLRVGPQVLHVAKVLPEQNRLLTLSLVEVRESAVLRRVDAREARWEHDRWIFLDAEERIFDPSGAIRTVSHPRLAYPLPASPKDFRIEKLQPAELPWAKLRRQVRRLRAQGLDSSELEVGLWAKTSMPFTSLIMVLIGFPFALRADRRGGPSVGIATGLLLGFCYWLVLAVGLSLGKAGVLVSPLAAWTGNLLFTGVGAALLWRAERNP
ncbi:MAG: LPS export ABC transporter permease LptG [Deltaproteobacteria bacterium]|nr:LPS export ABC transporter permease LptG [Deltaproteobacteria bacterium]